MKIVQSKYINSIFTRGKYSSIKESELISYIQIVNRSLIEDAKTSNDIEIISQTFSLAIEDFILTYGPISNGSDNKYNFNTVLFLFTTFLDKLDTLTRLGLLNEDIAIEKFVYAVGVFEDRSSNENELLDSLG